MAKTTQLAIMVRRTVYSKGGQSMRNLVSRLRRLLSRSMKREVGPSFFSSGFSFFLLLLILTGSTASEAEDSSLGQKRP
jgi:hypothetical protein